MKEHENSIVIVWNEQKATGMCGLCAEPIFLPVGPCLYLLSNRKLICRKCGASYSPQLESLLEFVLFMKKYADSHLQDKKQMAIPGEPEMPTQRLPPMEREREEKKGSVAREEANKEGISEVLTDTLQRFVSADVAKAAGFEEVIIHVGSTDEKDMGRNLRKFRFFGRLLIKMDVESEEKQRKVKHQLFITRKGKFLHYRVVSQPTKGKSKEHIYDVYDSIDQIHEVPPGLKEEAIKSLGRGQEVVIDLDL